MRIMLAALMTSTALVGFASAALAADKLIDGSDEQFTTLESFEKITVGDVATGSLTISNGGQVAASDLVAVGWQAGSKGTITVSGAGSSLTQTTVDFTDLVIGAAGTGALYVLDGAQVVTNQRLIVSRYAGSGGSVTISGGGSKFTSAKNVYIANGEASATLSVLAGGEFHTDGRLQVAESTDSRGTITVSGAGSKLTAVAGINLGDGGTGIMEVSDGGLVQSSGRISIGRFRTGIATVTGTGSRLTGKSLVVGDTSSSTVKGTVNVVAGGQVDIATTIALGQDSTANGTLTISGAGSKVSAGSGTSVGVAGKGTLTISDAGELSSGGTVAFGADASSEGIGSITGTGSTLSAQNVVVAKSGDGSLTVSKGGTLKADTLDIAQTFATHGALNIGAASGESAAEAGTIATRNGTPTEITFGIGNGKIVFNHTETAYDFDANVSGDGTISQEAGYTTLTGDYSGFTGFGSVSGGTLDVATAFVGAMNVLSGGTLTGSGSVGALNFASGSTYRVDAGSGQTLTSTGTITLDAGSALAVEFSKASGVWQPITLLSGASLAGTFDTTNQDDFTFLNFSLDYSATSVLLNVARNGVAFSSVAITPNQKSVAGAVDALGTGNAIYDAFALLQSEDDARNALDQLSGDAHASLQGTTILNAGFARDIVGSRLDAGDTSNTGVLSEVDIGDGSPPIVLPTATGTGMWAQTYGAFGKVQGDATSAGQETLSGGLFLGAETDDFHGFKAGVLAGYGRTHTTADARNASADVDSYTLGAYAGRYFGPVHTKFAATYAVNAVGSQRDIAFGVFSDTVKANYLSRTFQVLGEVGYRFGDDKAWQEPFIGAEILNLQTFGFTESGGAAALSVGSASQTLGVTTVGVRAGGEIGTTEDGTTISYNAALGWRHAFGELASQTTSAFASGGPSFSVVGTPIAQDTALIEAGLDFDLSGSADLSLTYRGEFSQRALSNGLSARLSGKF